MKRIPASAFARLIPLLVAASAPAAAQITFQEMAGFTGLPSGANGAGIVLGLVEADTNGSTTINDYRASRAGITFTYQDAADPTQTYGFSGHANTVMARYADAATGVTQVINTEALSFYNRHLGITATGYPTASVSSPVSDVINLSFIFNNLSDSTAGAIEARTDYLTSKWNKVVVAGVSTSGGIIATPGSAYNAISVAELNQTYTAPNRTNLDTTGGPTPGRLKPDLLAPSNPNTSVGGAAPSFAAPVVSAAAAVLLQTARATPALSAATDARVIKSLLLTGATKLDGWSAAPSNQPLDYDQGAGVVHAANSHELLLAGRAPASVSVAHGLAGWDLGTVTEPAGPSLAEAWYYVDLSEAQAAAGFTVTATLAWNRAVADDLATVTLRNLDLQLYSVVNGTFTPSTALATSNSTLDNVEHIYASFGAGVTTRYAFRVGGVGFGNGVSETYALSWNIVPDLASPIPEPAQFGLLAGLAGLGLAATRRRRSPGAARN